MQYKHDKTTAAPIVTAAFTLALLLGGCGENTTAPSDQAPAIVRSYERGPFALQVTASSGTITTADTLKLTLEATLEDGYSVAFPAYPAPNDDSSPEEAPSDDTTPASFTHAGYEDTPPALQDSGHVKRSRVYQLEPFLDGMYEIPPLTVSYWQEIEGEDQKNTLETEPISISVASVLAAGAEPSLMEIAGPQRVRDPIPWVRYALIAALLAGVAAGLYWYKYRYTPPGPPPPLPIPPHQRALEALEDIRRSKLVEQGLYKEYYVRVSDVLRRYMEDQFQLRAPERTTEEFLEDIQHNAVLGLQEQLLLREFLRHCDLVKFARVEPTSEQINETMETCERFIIDSEAVARAARNATLAEREG